MAAESLSVTVLDERAFGDAELYELLGTYGWDYVILRENIIVAEPGTEGVPAADLVLAHGRVRQIVDATVTRKKTKVAAVCS